MSTRNTHSMGELFKIRDFILSHRMEWDRKVSTREACNLIKEGTGLTVSEHQIRNMWRQDPTLRWNATRLPHGTKQRRGGYAVKALTVAKARLIWNKIKKSETGELLDIATVSEIDDLFDEWLDGKDADGKDADG
jgi:hypothetical protein